MWQIIINVVDWFPNTLYNTFVGLMLGEWFTKFICSVFCNTEYLLRGRKYYHIIKSWKKKYFASNEQLSKWHWSLFLNLGSGGAGRIKIVKACLQINLKDELKTAGNTPLHCSSPTLNPTYIPTYHDIEHPYLEDIRYIWTVIFNTIYTGMQGIAQY